MHGKTFRNFLLLLRKKNPKKKNPKKKKKKNNSTKKIGIEQNFLPQNDLVSLTIKLSFSNQLQWTHRILDIFVFFIRFLFNLKLHIIKIKYFSLKWKTLVSAIIIKRIKWHTSYNI